MSEPDRATGTRDENGTGTGSVDRSAHEEHAPPRSPRWHPATKNIAGIALGVAALAALYLARNALALVALAGLIAFLVAPSIRLLQRRGRFPKVLALLASYAMLVVVVALLGGLIVVGIVASFSEIDPAEAADSLRSNAVDLLSNVRSIGIAGYDIDFSETVDPMIDRLTSNDALDAATDAGTETTITVGAPQLDRLLGGLVTSAQTVGGLLVAVLVTFLIALYLNADSHRFHAGLLAHLPRGYLDDANRMSQRMREIWQGYLYGQLANSVATGLLVWLVLWAVGLPGAFVLGLIMMLLNMIPTFGPIIAAVPGVLAAMTLGSTRLDWSTLAFTLLVIGIYVVVVQLQANVMAPFITGYAVQMSPATILIGLIVGFQVGGLVGSLLVVPVLASLKELGRYVLAKLLDRDPFDEDPEDAPDEDPARSTASDPAEVDELAATASYDRRLPRGRERG